MKSVVIGAVAMVVIAVIAGVFTNMQSQSSAESSTMDNISVRIN